MHNKKVLSEIDLGKYKKPNPYKDDIILSNEGQWKYPGEVTRIPSNEITMEDVPYMVWAQPNVGPGIMMEPGEDYYFDNADYVDEYPQIAKQGGALKKNNTSRSIKATNKLFAQNYLFKKPGKKKIFDPNSKYFQEGGEFVEMELDDEDIELFRQGGYIVEDISVPQLTKAQEGKETGVESYTSWENAPEEYAPYVTNLKEANVVAEAAPWAKLSNEYEKKNSKEAFIESKKRDYLKKSNKGLNKMAGLSMDNFPKDVASNFADEYEYKKNNYVTKKLGKQKGFNPRKRDEWVEELSPGERKVVANSKYGNKLQPGYWNRALAGVQELGNTVLPGQPFNYKIPGLTKKEQKEMKDSSVSALEVLAPMDIPGAVAANYLKNNGLSTGSNFKNQPAVYSGERMANVDETDAMALSPLTYAGLQEIPASVYNAVKSTIKGTVKGAKALPGAIKTSKESGLLSKVYKSVPLELPGSPNNMYDEPVKAGLDGNFITRPLTLFTKNELTNIPGKNMAYRKIGNKSGLQDLINKGGAQAPGPLRMKSGVTIDTPFFGFGKKPTESYKGMYAVEVDPANPKYKWSSRVAGTDNYGSAPFDRNTEQLIKNIPIEDLNVYRKKWFSNNYKKLDPENLEAGLKNADEQYLAENAWKWGIRGAVADQVFNDGEYTKKVKDFLDSYPKKEEGGSTNEIIETELTPEEIEWYKSQGYEIEELD
jgi:hypothetical protein